MKPIKLLTTSDIAARFNVAIITATKWCARHLFPNAQKVGRDWIVPETDLLKFKPPNPKGGYPKGKPRKTPKK